MAAGAALRARGNYAGEISLVSGNRKDNAVTVKLISRHGSG